MLQFSAQARHFSIFGSRILPWMGMDPNRVARDLFSLDNLLANTFKPDVIESVAGSTTTPTAKKSGAQGSAKKSGAGTYKPASAPTICPIGADRAQPKTPEQGDPPEQSDPQAKRRKKPPQPSVPPTVHNYMTQELILKADPKNEDPRGKKIVGPPPQPTQAPSSSSTAEVPPANWREIIEKGGLPPGLPPGYNPPGIDGIPPGYNPPKPKHPRRAASSANPIAAPMSAQITSQLQKVLRVVPPPPAIVPGSEAAKALHKNGAPKARCPPPPSPVKPPTPQPQEAPVEDGEIATVDSYGGLMPKTEIQRLQSEQAEFVEAAEESPPKRSVAPTSTPSSKTGPQRDPQRQSGGMRRNWERQLRHAKNRGEEARQAFIEKYGSWFPNSRQEDDAFLEKFREDNKHFGYIREA